VLRSQVLELLQSTSVTNSTIALTLPSSLQPLVLPDLDSIGAASAASAAAGGPAGDATARGRPGTGQKGPAGKAATGEHCSRL
jgi:hypothetical protein